MATGTSPRTSASAFHGDDPEQTTEYRTLSVLALVSLIFGLASPLCFGAVLLMAIPLAGIAISILALRRIAASGGTLAGKWLAVTGLILCVVFAVAPVTRVYVLRSIRTRQADEFARNWIDSMLAGKSPHAFRLTMDSTRPPRPPEPGQPPPKGTPFDAFLEIPVVKQLAAVGPDATVRPVGEVTYDPQSFYRVLVRQKYEITPKAATDDAKPVELMITVQHAKLPTEGRMRWMVWQLENANKPATPPLQ